MVVSPPDIRRQRIAPLPHRRRPYEYIELFEPGTFKPDATKLGG